MLCTLWAYVHCGRRVEKLESHEPAFIPWRTTGVSDQWRSSVVEPRAPVLGVFFMVYFLVVPTKQLEGSL